MSETQEHKIERLEDVIWKLEKQMDEIPSVATFMLYKNLAASRLELLRRCNNIMPTCPECKGNLRTWSKIDENKTIRVGHADDCELAKELGDE